MNVEEKERKAQRHQLTISTSHGDGLNSQSKWGKAIGDGGAGTLQYGVHRKG